MSQENLSKPVESQEPVNIAQKLSENMDKALNAPKAVEKEVAPVRQTLPAAPKAEASGQRGQQKTHDSSNIRKRIMADLNDQPKKWSSSEVNLLDLIGKKLSNEASQEIKQSVIQHQDIAEDELTQRLPGSIPQADDMGNGTLDQDTLEHIWKALDECEDNESCDIDKVEDHLDDHLEEFGFSDLLANRRRIVS